MHINPVPIFSRGLNFWSQGISWDSKGMFQNTRNKKVLVTKWFLAFPAMFLPTNTSFRFRKMVKWSPKVVTFLVQLRACCAVVSKLSTLSGFVAHCKTRGFNISLHKLLNSILLKTKQLICLKIAVFHLFCLLQ